MVEISAYGIHPNSCPVGLAFAAVLLVLLGGLMRQRPALAPTPSTVSLVDFRPVSDLNVRVILRHESN